MAFGFRETIGGIGTAREISVDVNSSSNLEAWVTSSEARPGSREGGNASLELGSEYVPISKRERETMSHDGIGRRSESGCIERDPHFLLSYHRHIISLASDVALLFLFKYRIE